MVEILTTEKLIESLSPFDPEELFICERDERGKVVAITEVWEYLTKSSKRSRGEANTEDGI